MVAGGSAGLKVADEPEPERPDPPGNEPGESKPGFNPFRAEVDEPAEPQAAERVVEARFMPNPRGK